jgi:hypothetical protein
MTGGTNTRGAALELAGRLERPLSVRRLGQLVEDGVIPAPEKDCSGNYRWKRKDLDAAARVLRAAQARRRKKVAR